MTDSTDPYNRYKPAIDVADGLKRVMNNKKLYFSLIKRFKAREMVLEVVTQIQKNDAVMIKQKAHAVKGAVGNLGLPLLWDIAREIEERAKAEQNCDDLIAPLQTVLEQTEIQINELLENES